MSIVKNLEQYNREYRRCKALKIPFIVLETHGKKAQLNYDMWPINYDLTSKAAKQIYDLFEKLVFDPTVRGSITWSAGITNGFIHRIPRVLADEYLPKLAEIVNNSENWVSIASDKEWKCPICGSTETKIGNAYDNPLNKPDSHEHRVGFAAQEQCKGCGTPTSFLKNNEKLIEELDKYRKSDSKRT